MKKRRSSLPLVIILIIGIGLVLYPFLSNRWNIYHQSKVIAEYSDSIPNLNSRIYEQLLSDAAEYNRLLSARKDKFSLPEDQQEEYESLLNVSGNGAMGYISIPSIQVEMPIYHGTGTDVLQIGAGHVEWSSLPVGGTGSHCVLSGHRGLPGAKLFTDLDKLEVGDVFQLRILHETLTYEVDQILTVEPENILPLAPEEGMDYCTLVTCTPYGINTHRLLVRGHRVDNSLTQTVTHIVSEASRIPTVYVAAVVFPPAVLVLAILFQPRNKRTKGGRT